MGKIEDIARDYVAQAASMFAKGEAITSMLLSKKGHTSDNPLEFNTDGMNMAMCAPTAVSTNSQGEYSYCFIVKIWVDEANDKVYGDLYDYDRAEDLECVCLSEDNKTKWENIIVYLI